MSGWVRESELGKGEREIEREGGVVSDRTKMRSSKRD